MSTAEKKKTGQLNPSAWAKVTVLWELGEANLEELSAIFGISTTAISKGLKKRGAIRGSRAHEIGEAVVEQAKNASQKRIEKIDQMKDQYSSYSDLLAKLTMKEISEAIKTSTPIGDKKDNLIALQKAVSNISKLREENYHLLGLFDPDAVTEEMPDIGITEYTKEELAEIQRNYEVPEDIDDEIDQAIEDLKTKISLPFDEAD